MTSNVNIPIYETKAISKDFILPDGHALRVLEKMDVQIYPNEILAIIGPSGCGKSTFLRIFTGLIPPTKGQIFYHGKQIKGLLPNFSLVFQSFALYPWMTVTQNIKMVLKTMNLSDEEVKQRTSTIISMIGLTGSEDSYPRELSGGMKQRVGLARALVRYPELLLLDEPFSSLDPFTAESLRDELLDIWRNKKNGLNSIVLISHDVREVAYMADRIILMEGNPGRIRSVKINILPRPRDYHSQEFLNLVDELHDTYSQVKIPSREEITLPLLPVTIEEIMGFLSYLQRHGESKNLYQISAGTTDHFERVILRAKAAELLKFVKIEHRTVRLSDEGKKLLSADYKKKHTLWKDQILTIGIIAKAMNWLKDAPKHSLSHKELIDLIAKEFPEQNAQEQWKTLVSWGSYGNLFTYHKSTKSISLKEAHN